MTIQISIHHFAVVREIVGRSNESREVPDGATAGDVISDLAREFPELGKLGSSALVMVNHTYAKLDTPLHNGDELAFIPPVSGGAGVRHFAVTSEVLDARQTEAIVRHTSCGAVLSFIGEVRDFARGETVTALYYEAYAAAAEHQMGIIADEIEQHFGVDRIAIVHRTGSLQPGDASVVISVASPHRAEAFDAARHAIERLKVLVPIWKREHYASGSTWIGSEADYQRSHHPE